MFTLEDFAQCSTSYKNRGLNRGRYGITCRSEKEADECCRWMASIGKTWSDGNSYLDDTCFFGDIINYYNNGMYSSCNDIFNRYADDYMEWSDLVAFTNEDKEMESSEVLENMLDQLTVL